MFQKHNGKIMLSDGGYAKGKKIVQIWIPALSSLYFGLGNIWGFPSVEQVVGTLAVVATFLGVCLGLSSRQYDSSGAAFDGQINVDTIDGGKKVFSLELKGDPEQIETKEAVTFKINPGAQV